MTYPRLLGTVAVVLGLFAAQQLAEDPVMKIRAQRAQTGGEQDLPPVPRTVLEPPPLPPPELHVKDTPGYRAKRKGKKGKAVVAKRGRKGKVLAKKGAARVSKASKGTPSPKPTKAAKAPRAKKSPARKK